MIDADCRNCLEKCMCYCVRPLSKGKHLIDDNKFVYSPVRIGGGRHGGSILLYGRRRSSFPFQCMVGPDWPAMILVYALIIGIDAGVLYVIAPLGWPVIAIGIIGCIGLLCSYTTVACSDPGIVYKDSSDDDDSVELGNQSSSIIGNRSSNNSSSSSSSSNGMGNGSNSSNSNGHTTISNNISAVAGTNSIHTVGNEVVTLSPHDDIETNINGDNSETYNNIVESKMETLSNQSIPMLSTSVLKQKTMECGNCEIQRPLNARHCIYCGVCIENLDHHCPWSGKCIGKRNMMAFQIFITFLCCQMYFLIGAFIYFCVVFYSSEDGKTD